MLYQCSYTDTNSGDTGQVNIVSDSIEGALALASSYITAKALSVDLLEMQAVTGDVVTTTGGLA